MMGPDAAITASESSCRRCHLQHNTEHSAGTAEKEDKSKHRITSVLQTVSQLASASASRIFVVAFRMLAVAAVAADRR